MIPSQFIKMIRNIRSALRKALVIQAFAISLLVAPSVAFDPQESGGSNQRNRDPDALTFTRIDFPGAMFTAAFGTNDRGQIVGSFQDADHHLRRPQVRLSQ